MRSVLSIPYAGVRHGLQTGDLVFFAGQKNLFSRIIRTFTGLPTHVAVIYRVEAQGDPSRIQIIESTSLNRWRGKRGVQAYPLSEKLTNCPDETTWLALLKPELRARLDPERWLAYLRASEGRPYDYLQAFGSGLHQYLGWLPAHSFRRFLYCSELACGSLQEGGVIPPDWDPCPTPHQLAQWDLYSEVLHIQGRPESFPSPTRTPWKLQTPAHFAGTAPPGR